MDFENKVLNILGEILQRVTNLEQKVTTLEERITTLEDRMTALEDRMTALEEKVASLDQRVLCLEQDISLLKAKVYVMDEKLNNMEDKLDLLKEDHIYISRTVAKIEFESDNKFQALFDYIEVNRAEHQCLENLINSKISEDRIFFKTILDNHEKRITALESAKIS